MKHDEQQPRTSDQVKGMTLAEGEPHSPPSVSALAGTNEPSTAVAGELPVKSQGQISPGSIATFLVESAAILAALLFLTGWQYGHAYYSVFGVGLTQIDVPIPHYFVWIRPIIFEYWYWTSPILVGSTLAVVGGGILLQQRFSSARGGVRRVICAAAGDTNLRILIVLLIFLLTFPLVSSKAGRDHGERDLYGETTTLPVASISLKNPEGDPNAMLRLREVGVSDGDYYLLGRHRGAYYLVPYRSRNAIRFDSTPRVVIIPDDLVANLRIKE